MLASTGDISIEPPTASPLAAIEHESCKTVEVLEELLTQSVHLRGLYKNARCQVSDIGCHRLRQLFDAHYRGQVHLVDVLIDRIRDLDGAGGVYAGDLLRGAHFCQPLRGRAPVARLMEELVDAHEFVLSTALPAGTTDGKGERSWARDFAVGQVVLTNEQQLFEIGEQMLDRETNQRLQTSAALG